MLSQSRKIRQAFIATLLIPAFLWGSESWAKSRRVQLRHFDRDHALEAEREVERIINEEIRPDLEENFDERLQALKDKEAMKASGKNSKSMSQATQAVLLKGAYETLSLLSPVMLPEDKFNAYTVKVLQWLAVRGVFPQAITLGALARKTVGSGVTAGINFGVEANFYVSDGKLKMTNYALLGGQVGVGTAVNAIEYYVALCFGSCYGGDPEGWYLGMDGGISAGIGGDFFGEVGLDMSSLFRALFSDNDSASLEDLYEASTFYVGFGVTSGLGGEVAVGLYHYDQMGEEVTLSSPGQAISSQMIKAKAGLIRPK